MIQRFLYTLSLSTGATLITLSLAINKLSGVYGILALFTGYSLSPLQLSMYIYSVLALVLTIYLSQHIRRQSPLQCLALAWFYVLDSVINAAYTAVFAVSWFLVLLAHQTGQSPTTSAGNTISDTSGFTSPEHNVSKVDIISAAPANSTTGPIADAHPANSPAGTPSNPTTLQGAVLSTESLNSIGIICVLWTIRLYFCLIMLGWARMVIRTHIASASTTTTTSKSIYTSASPNAALAENPFDASRPEGSGYGGKLGRFLISLGRSYWLGKDEDDSWMYGMKFRRSTPGDATVSEGVLLSKIETGPAERERRRRSGTGPPPPQPELTQGDGKTLAVPGTPSL